MEAEEVGVQGEGGRVFGGEFSEDSGWLWGEGGGGGGGGDGGGEGVDGGLG